MDEINKSTLQHTLTRQQHGHNKTIYSDDTTHDDWNKRLEKLSAFAW